jgi:hypothetical protein
LLVRDRKKANWVRPMGVAAGWAWLAITTHFRNVNAGGWTWRPCIAAEAAADHHVG